MIVKKLLRKKIQLKDSIPPFCYRCCGQVFTMQMDIERWNLLRSQLRLSHDTAMILLLPNHSFIFMKKFSRYENEDFSRR